MTAPRHLLRDIFNQAVEIEDARQRADYLEKACGSDAALQKKIEELIAADAAAGSFLGQSSSRGGRDYSGPSQLSADPPALTPPDSDPGLTVQDAIPEHPGDLIGPYKLLQRIGEGGMGVVYMAEQVQPVRRRVALKVIKLGMDTKQVLARFEAEGQALALMDHPNIAKVFEVGATASGRPYMAMELVRGIKITEYCDKSRLSTKERLELCIKVCQSLQHAHQKGIIHRDLKPSNILITVNDGVAVPKVIDFGIAKAVGQKLTDKTLFTEFQAFIGTPAYMSPEQTDMSSVDIDTRSDIYALGVLLYQLLTGRTPFDGMELLKSGLDEMRRIIREDEPLRPSNRLSTLLEEELSTLANQRRTDTPKLIHSIRGDLDWIVMKCLDKDRSRRYETANGLAADIGRYLSNEPIVARSPSSVYRIQKFIRRNKLVFTATSAVVLALIVGLGLSIWQFMEKNEAWKSVTAARDRADANASEARANAQQAQANARKALASEQQIKVNRAEELFNSGDSHMALAQLASVLRDNPHNGPVAERMVSAISQRAFCFPSTSPLQHQHSLQTARFSPDGRMVATVMVNHEATVWEVKSGKMLRSGLKHDRRITSIQFNPDGEKLLTTSLDNTARIWEIGFNWKETVALAHDSSLCAARFSRDGKGATTVSELGGLRRWKLGGTAVEGAVAKVAGDNLQIYHANFSRTGQSVVTASLDGKVRAWDHQTLDPLGPPIIHREPVEIAQISPAGEWVVTVSDKTRARVWNTATGLKQAEFTKHDGHIVSIQFSPDGSRIVSTSTDQTARIWDATSGRQLTPPLRHQGTVYSGRFSPNGLQLITASADRTARNWNVETGEQLTEPLRHVDDVLLGAFSPAGNRIITIADNSEAILWEVPLRAEFRGAQLTAKPAGAAMSVASDSKSEPLPPDPDSETIIPRLNGLFIFDSFDFPVHASPEWHGVKNEGPEFVQRKEFELLVSHYIGKAVSVASIRNMQDQIARYALSKGVYDVAVVTPGQALDRGVLRVAVFDRATFFPSRPGNDVQDDGSLTRRYPIEMGPDVIFTRAKRDWEGRPREFMFRKSVQFSPQGTEILAAAGSVANRWNISGNQKISSQFSHSNTVISVAFSPDGKWAVTAGLDMTSCVWDAQTGRLSATMKHQGPVYWASFSPDGLSILIASFDGTAQIWEARSGRPLAPPVQHGKWIYSAQFSPDGTRFVTASADATARVWDARSSRPITAPLQHQGRVYSACFSPDGRRVVTTSEDHTAKTWDASTGAQLTPPLQHAGLIYSADFSPDGSLLVTASADNSARIWNSQTGEIAADVLRHQAQVYSARFSPDGHRIVTASEDQSARIWNAHTGLPLSEPLRHAETVYLAQFNPAGDLLITASGTQDLRLWHLLPPPLPIPAQWTSFAEAVGGKRFDGQGNLESVPLEEILDLKKTILNDTRTNYYPRLGRWIFSASTSRTASPFSPSEVR